MAGKLRSNAVLYATFASCCPPVEGSLISFDIKSIAVMGLGFRV